MWAERGADVRRPEEIQVFVCRRSGEQFLVLHRSPELGGYWHPASGALELGEDAQQGAVRELREELEELWRKAVPGTEVPGT